MDKTINIFHFMPDKLNLYGDIGNVIALKQRAKWAGVDVTVTDINSTAGIQLSDADILFIGGGSDREQKIATDDLFRIKDEFKAAIEDGMPALTICGGYQFLGEKYITLDGQELKGLNILDFYTESKKDRLIGNIVIESETFGQIVGFENHGGRTYHQYNTLGNVVSGYGNNDTDKKEGIHYKNLLGTYLHGPILPKNHEITDYLLRAACERKGIKFDNQMIDNRVEEAAKSVIVKRLLENK
ncbi:type 1 glutamine amidotransferase [Macrococcus sp. DPC7161]|uniref:type 1 glutamine amidotransferase n=1 Tax=Macrococcus sp. DPC7161 TaxID=2507060 RepID=UPI00100AA0E4|nr:glutamine amidotransferase [Macrococcus sp. DPC7161]RXK17764.1 glutamine amidotransferase [Macrococcus sp. DPC7161]